MAKSIGLDRIKKLVQLQGEHTVPSASMFAPEIRSDHKWPFHLGKSAATQSQEASGRRKSKTAR